jgi:hypothetical protein
MVEDEKLIGTPNKSIEQKVKLGSRKSKKSKFSSSQESKVRKS